MGDREKLLDSFNTAFDSAGRAVDEVKKKFDECTDNVTGLMAAAILGPIPLYLSRKKLGEIGEDIKKVIGLVEYAAQHRLPVIALINQSFNWLESVKAPMSEMSSRTSVWRDQNLDYWREAAGFTYRAKVTAQQGAIDDVAAKADFISKWLLEIAQSNVAYMVELAGFAAEVAGKLAKVAVDTGTIALIPFAVDEGADIVGSLVETGLKNLIKEAERFVNALGKIRDAESQLVDYTKYPGGKWPEAVVG